MPIIVVACYRPKPGKEKDLLACTRDHIPTLAAQGLVTERKAIVGRAKDGTIVEVFEWKSQAAIEKAHSNPEVLKLWQRYGECCDYVAPATVPG